jgi:SAM-dependent methyltransferase
VVGSPRSGTSVFTWALGQHPNLFPIEESNWMSKFAIDLWSTYGLGAGRGNRSHLTSMGIEREEFYAECGRLIDGLIHRNREQFEQLSYLHSVDHPEEINEAFQISRVPDEPKTRWVDGTPEYSLGIVALRKLFPDARFIHLVRDARPVVKSLVNFVRDDGAVFAANEQEAYEYWLRTVRACYEAELAYGNKVIIRVRYRDLIGTPEPVLRRCLEFLGEPFSPLCLEPLETRINSSTVPPDFELDDSGVDPKVIAEAEALSHEVLDGPRRSIRANRTRISALEREFIDLATWAGLLWEEGSDPRLLYDAFDRERGVVIRLRAELENARDERAKAQAAVADRERDLRRATAEAALNDQKVAAVEHEALLLRETVEALREEAGWLRDSVAQVIDAAHAAAHERMTLVRVRELIRDTVPLGASVLVVSKGDDNLLRIGGRRAAHFPQGRDGAYAGYHPEGSAEAIAHLEALRSAGAEYLVLPSTSLWWMEHYKEFRDHLLDRYVQVAYEEGAGAIFALGERRVEKTVRRSPSELAFRCNVCGTQCSAALDDLKREVSSCPQCESTVRFRGVVHVLSKALFGESLALPDFPFRPELVGIGLTDWSGYADWLAEKLSYQNTFLHQEPILDITKDDLSRHKTADFVICSEVLEHVAPPVDDALRNLWALLKPGGALVLSVPYQRQAETIEHFPDLYDFELNERDGRPILRNRTRDGQLQEFTDLVFHGGPGTTLEMRLFGEQDLLERLARAGFRDVAVDREDYLPFGIHWQENWSLPIIARR